MATYSKFLELVSGSATTINLATSGNALGIASLQLLGSTSGTLTINASATTTPYTLTMPSAQGGSGQVLTDSDGAGTLTWATLTAGTVTSVTFTGDGTVLSSTPSSAVTTSGTLTASLNNQSANRVLAGPTSGGAVAPTFRALVAADIPSLSYANTALSNLGITSINADLIPSGNAIHQLGSQTLTWQNLYTNTMWANTWNDTAGNPFANIGGGIANFNSLADGNTSIDVSGRELYEGVNGNLSLDWSHGFGTGGGYLDVNSNLISNVSDPVSAQDAATKNYVDMHAGTGTVTTVSVVSANGLAGTVANSGTTPAITLSTTVTAPVLAANGTAISAATTTGSGSTVVLANAPTFAGAVNMGGFVINSLGSPVLSTDAATKGYVDTAINGLTWKGPVQAYSNTNVALTGGSTLTIDSYSVQNGNYVILGNQTTATQNGVYVASGIGTAYVLTLLVNSEASTAIGDAYLIEKGTVYGNSAFQVNQITPNVTYIQFAGPNTYTFSSPLSLSGNIVSLGYDNSTIGVTSNQLVVKTGGVGTTQLAAASVTYAKIQNETASTLLGNPTGGAVAPSEITLGATLAFSGSALQTVAMTGDVTSSANNFATTVTKIQGVTVSGTTGTGNVVFSASPALTGTVTGVNATLSGNLSVSTNQIAATAGQTFIANTSYAVRWGITSNGETATRIYAADITTSSFNLFYVIGMVSGGAGITAGNPITVTRLGLFTLSSSDPALGTTATGTALFLTASGTFSTTAPSASGQAVTRIGIVQNGSATAASNVIDIAPQTIGIN